MTVRYNQYLEALQTGVIDLNNVSLSVIVVSKYYKPKATDTFQNVTSKLADFKGIFIDDDMLKLSMSEIIDRVTGYCKTYKDLNNLDLLEVSGFVVYAQDLIKVTQLEGSEPITEIIDVLCFYEDLKIVDNG